MSKEFFPGQAKPRKSGLVTSSALIHLLSLSVFKPGVVFVEDRSERKRMFVTSCDLALCKSFSLFTHESVD